MLEEEEEEERGEGEGEGEGEDSSLDLNCQEDFETAVVNPAQEIVLGNSKFCLPGPAQEVLQPLPQSRQKKKKKKKKKKKN